MMVAKTFDPAPDLAPPCFPAAEHDEWFRLEVERTLAGIADGSIQLPEETGAEEVFGLSDLPLSPFEQWIGSRRPAAGSR